MVMSHHMSAEKSSGPPVFTAALSPDLIFYYKRYQLFIFNYKQKFIVF